MSCVGLTAHLKVLCWSWLLKRLLDEIVDKIDKIQWKSPLRHVPSPFRSLFLVASLLLFLPDERCAKTSQSKQTTTRRRKKETVRIAMSWCLRWYLFCSFHLSPVEKNVQALYTCRIYWVWFYRWREVRDLGFRNLYNRTFLARMPDFLSLVH